MTLNDVVSILHRGVIVATGIIVAFGPEEDIIWIRISGLPWGTVGVYTRDVYLQVR